MEAQNDDKRRTVNCAVSRWDVASGGYQSGSQRAPTAHDGPSVRSPQFDVIARCGGPAIDGAHW